MRMKGYTTNSTLTRRKRSSVWRMMITTTITTVTLLKTSAKVRAELRNLEPRKSYALVDLPPRTPLKKQYDDDSTTSGSKRDVSPIIKKQSATLPPRSMLVSLHT